MFDPHSKGTLICSPCRFWRWVDKNADAIEDYIADGSSFTKSVKLVRQDNRPICISCGKRLIYQGRWLCESSPECNLVRVRYGFYRKRKGFDKVPAAKKALSSVHGRLIEYYR